MFFSISNLQAQRDQRSASAGDMKYKLIYKYPQTVKNKYRFSESTNIIRTYSDSSKKNFSRNVDYYFSQFPKEAPAKDFVSLQISIDSMEYRYQDDKNRHYFKSPGIDSLNSDSQDITYLTVPLGRLFEFSYTPYGELTDLKGERLDWLKKYVLVTCEKALDTFQKSLWLNGISAERLAYITDVKKISFPTGTINADSLWSTPFQIQFDYITFNDTIKAKVDKHQEGNYLIVAYPKNFKLPVQPIIVNDLKEFMYIDSIKTNDCRFTLTLGPRGTLKRSDGEFNCEIFFRNKSGSVRYRETLNSRCIWDLSEQQKKF